MPPRQPTASPVRPDLFSLPERPATASAPTAESAPSAAESVREGVDRFSFDRTDTDRHWLLDSVLAEAQRRRPCSVSAPAQKSSAPIAAKS